MLALRAGLEALQAVVDRVFDAGVVAQLEMQAGAVDVGAPVAAVERRVIAVADRRGDRLFASEGAEHHHPPAQRGADAAKELGGERGHAAEPLEGAAVMAVNGQP